MPRVPKHEVQPQDLYGVAKVDNNLTMRERMKKRFRPTDTVMVHNITDKRVEWQWLDEQDEEYVIEDETNIKITDRKEPGLWYLDAGESDMLYGANAYMMIEALYKQVCVLKTGVVINPLSEREIRNFSIDDPEKQEQFIDAVFVRKMSPQDMNQAALESLGIGGAPKIVEHLPSLPTERDEYNRRAAGARAMNKTGSSKDLADLANEFDAGETLLGTATGGLPTDRGTLHDESTESEQDAPAEQKPTAPKTNKKPATASA